MGTTPCWGTQSRTHDDYGHSAPDEPAARVLCPGVVSRSDGLRPRPTRDGSDGTTSTNQSWTRHPRGSVADRVVGSRTSTIRWIVPIAPLNSIHRRRTPHTVVSRVLAGVPPAALNYLVGEIGSRGLQFLVLIAVARLLDPSAFAFVSLYFGLANMAAVVVGLGLPNAVLRYYFEPIPYADVVGSIAGLVGASAVIGLVLVGLFADPIAAFLRIPVGLLAPCVLGGIAIAMRTAWTTSLRARKRSRVYSAALLIEPFLGVALIPLVLVVTGRFDAVTLAWSFCLGTVLIATAAVASLLRDPGLRWRRPLAVELLRFSAPLVFQAFAMYALGTYDQLVINQTIGPAEAGRYAFAYRWGMAMIAITAAFGALWQPRFQELVRINEQRARLDTLATRGIVALCMAAIGLMFVLPIGARLTATQEYLPALWLIPWVTYAYLWFGLYAIVMGWAMYQRRTGRLAFGSVTAVAFNIGANYLLVPRFGIGAAILTTILAYVALFAIQWWLVRDLISDIRYGRLTLLVAAVGLVAAGASLTTWFAL